MTLKKHRQAERPVHRIHISGHASADELRKFAAAVAPRRLVPIHSDRWDAHLYLFDNVVRVRDGKPFELGCASTLRTSKRTGATYRARPRRFRFGR